MASGTITGAMTGDYGLRIRWESVPDIATNTSKFTMRVYVLHPAIDISTRSGCYTTIDGSKVEFSTAAIDKSAGETLIKTRTATIAHGSDGKKSINVAAYFPIYVKSASEGWIYEKKAGGTCVLDEIPRASEISSQTQTVTVNGANKWNIAVNRHADSFRHKAVLTIGNYSHETPAFETTADYAIPTDWLNAIPDAKKGAVSVSLQTYSDITCTTKMGDAVTSSFEIVVPDSAAPTASAGWAKIAPYNTGTAASGMGVYVQGYSKAEVTFDTAKVSFKYGAGIASLRITCDGAEVSASPYRTKLLTKAGSQTVRCTVTDTRGMTATEDIAIDVQAYSAPVLSGISVYRCDASGSPDDAGAHLYFKATCVYSDCAGENTLSLKAAYKPAANTAWTSETSITSGTGKVLGGSLLSTVSYTARIKATDRIGNTAEYTALIGTADVAFNIRPGGKGAAFGKFAEKEKTLDIDDWDIATTGKVQAASGEFTGKVSAPNIITMLDVYPVGSIYMSVNATSPGALFGGTWVRIKDCFLLAAGSSYTAGATGGSEMHSLPLGDNGYAKLALSQSEGGLVATYVDTPEWEYIRKSNATIATAADTVKFGIPLGGSTEQGNIMPPYLAVYVWQRVADPVDPLEPISGDIVQFEYYAGVPVNVVTHIEPVQSGSGDPSPDNIRPITGHTGDVLTRCGKNLIPDDKLIIQDKNIRAYVGDPEGFLLYAGVTYTLSLGSTPANAVYVTTMDKAGGDGDIAKAYSKTSLTFTPSKDVRAQFNAYWTNGRPTDAYMMLELGSTGTAYATYNGETFTTDFGQTVYGGTLNWNTGVLTVAWGMIASYAGETLLGEWMSDRDVYTKGATPTTGAQVCYKLATPITIQLTPQEIIALGGVNTLFAEAGDITVGG